jgi:hypothetical protein
VSEEWALLNCKCECEDEEFDYDDGLDEEFIRPPWTSAEILNDVVGQKQCDS